MNVQVATSLPSFFFSIAKEKKCQAEIAELKRQGGAEKEVLEKERQELKLRVLEAEEK